MRNNTEQRVRVTLLENLYLPPELDGSLPPHEELLLPSQVNPKNDVEAINMWLADVASRPSTLNNYRLHVERCLLWATIVRGKPLSALAPPDAIAYSRFVMDPQPSSEWISPRSLSRGDPDWRPFRGPLTEGTRNFTVKVLSLFFDWMVGYGYITNNPWGSVICAQDSTHFKQEAPAAAPGAYPNVLSDAEWQFVCVALAELDDDLAAVRARALFQITYYADLKPSEISALRTSAIGVVHPGPQPVWRLKIEGRIPQFSDLILLPPAQKALETYFRMRGVVLDPSGNHDDTPVILPLRRVEFTDSGQVENMQSDSFNHIVKPVFARAAQIASLSGNTRAARRLSHATLGWLRHAFEVRVVQSHIRKNRAWMLLGSHWLIPPGFIEYLGTRKIPEVDTILDAFAELQCMWGPDDV
jgi:integrase/recombinase XerD